jgi:hypothetical protein
VKAFAHWKALALDFVVAAAAEPEAGRTGRTLSEEPDHILQIDSRRCVLVMVMTLLVVAKVAILGLDVWLVKNQFRVAAELGRRQEVVMRVEQPENRQEAGF